MAAPTDSAVIQGRIAIDQAVRILEGKDYLKHVGPEIYVVDKSNIKSFDYASSLAPAASSRSSRSTDVRRVGTLMV